MKDRSVSITGATGFFGGHIAEEFHRAGWRVRGIVRPGSVKPLPAGVERCEAALDSAALTAAFAGTGVVVHAAAIARSKGDAALQAVNVTGTQAVVDAANVTESRLVLISSQAAAGTGTVARPSREDNEPRPLTAYGRSKLGSEDVVRGCARIPWTILRPSAIYGPRDRQFLTLFRMAVRGRFLLAAKASTMFTLIDVRDAARAVLLVAGSERAKGATFFVGHPQAQSAVTVLEELARITKRSEKPQHVPAAIVWMAAVGGEIAWRCGFVPPIDIARLTELRAEGFVCSVDRIRDELGFTAAIPLREGLESTWAWYRDHRWV